MSTQKRFLLAFLLSFIAINVFLQLKIKYGSVPVDQQQPKENGTSTQKHQQNQPPKGVNDANDTGQHPNPPSLKQGGNEVQKFPVVAGEKEEIRTIETEKYLMKWSNKGAALVSLKMKEFAKYDTDKEKGDWRKESESWLELIAPFENNRYSLMFFYDDKDDTERLSVRNSFWKISEEKISKEDDPKVISFDITSEDGLLIRKSFKISNTDYAINGQVTLENKTDKLIKKEFAIGGASGISIEGDEAQYVQYFVGYRNKSNEIITKNYSHGSHIDLKERMNWTAVTNKYFACVLHVQEWDKFDQVFSREIVYDLHSKKDNPKLNECFLKTIPLSIQAQKSRSLNFKFLVSTKEELSQKDPELKELGSYGTFDIISQGLLWILSLFYSIFHSYGVAIIFLTIVVKSILHPITVRQQMSMQKYQEKMKKIQPKLLELQKKYKNNKQVLQKEMMELYQKEGISIFPLGGCLPIFLQLPIFIGLYNALLYSLKLRQAPFLWIKDLSMPDRLFQLNFEIPFSLGHYFNLLPILMTIIWIVQQKTMPKPEDPQMRQQQSIMLYMTLFFGFLFYNVAAGLVLYWLVMNLLSIFEQWIVKKKTGKAAQAPKVA